jgi:hypothetical protein
MGNIGTSRRGELRRLGAVIRDIIAMRAYRFESPARIRRLLKPDWHIGPVYWEVAVADRRGDSFWLPPLHWGENPTRIKHANKHRAANGKHPHPWRIIAVTTHSPAELARRLNLRPRCSLCGSYAVHGRDYCKTHDREISRARRAPHYDWDVAEMTVISKTLDKKRKELRA